MKKFLTLILALALAFGLSVPALAFTSDTTEDVDHPYDLSIYLVEYDDNDLFGIIALPESDRGYAKNEIVAAVVELDVPDGESPAADGYSALVFGGVNVDLEVVDNDLAYNVDHDGDAGTPAITTATLTCTPGTTDTFKYDDEDNRLIRAANFADDETYKWLFFAKVEDDGAMLVAKLVDGMTDQDFDEINPITTTLSGDTYTINKTAGHYTILATNGDYAGDSIIIDVDEDNVSEGMTIVIAAGAQAGTYPLGVNTDGELGIVKGAVIDTDGADYDAVMDIYEDVVVDAFGMDYFLIGNYVRDSFFEGLSSSDTIVAMVNIEPWTAYVSVPDTIVVDPPKTGDAASIMGFVMVALAGAGAVSLKKRG